MQLGHDSRVIWWRTYICSHWYVPTTRWQRQFDSGSFFSGFIYNIQKSSEHNRRCSKIVEVDLLCLRDQKILRAQLKTPKDCQSRLDSPKISNMVRTPNCNRVTKQWRHHHKSRRSCLPNRKCEWGLYGSYVVRAVGSVLRWKIQWTHKICGNIYGSLTNNYKGWKKS